MVARVVERFQQEFGRPPQVVARAPGRVNLFGDHVGMSGLPLLAAAIDREVVIAAAARSDRRVFVANASDEYESTSYQVQAGIRRFAAGNWANHHKAAAQAVVSTLGPETLHGGEFFVDGDVPPGAGLCSSTALVAASLLSVLGINGRDAEPESLAAMMRKANLYLGTDRVAADDSTCLFSQTDHAHWVEPSTQRHRSIPFLPDYAFVVSLLWENGADPVSRADRDQRIVECRLVCRTLDRVLGARAPRSLVDFGDLRRFFPERPLSDFATMLANFLPPRPLDLAEVAGYMGTSEERLRREIGIPQKVQKTYRLVDRARHIVTEAERVDQATRAIALGDGMRTALLLNASHASVRDDYGIGSPEVEALVTACQQCGAVATRLACSRHGACAVSLVAASEVPFFSSMMERLRHTSPPGSLPSAPFFAGRPSAGASLIRL
jgi:galactokinase